MKRLQRGVAPEVLRINGPTWTQEYVDAIASLRYLKERWRHDDIREALSLESGGNCAYCESRMADTSYPQVEHLLPKSRFPDLAHDWRNLARVCQICNTTKNDYWSEGLEVLNPYEDEVEERLRVRGGFVDWDLADDRAEITAIKLGLNRLELARSRTERLLAVRKALVQWQLADGAKKDVLKEGILLDAALGTYTRAVADLLKAHNFSDAQ